MSLKDLLDRVQAAEGANRELDRDIHAAIGVQRGRGTFPDGTSVPDGWGDLDTPYTASLDAALALVERKGFDTPQFLHEALEDMANGGWREDQPITPQICLYVLARLLQALISQEEGSQ